MPLVLIFFFNMFISQEKNTGIHYSHNTTHKTIKFTKIYKGHKVIHHWTQHGEHRHWHSSSQTFLPTTKSFPQRIVYFGTDLLAIGLSILGKSAA